MSELAPEMKAYLSSEEQGGFCARIAASIDLARRQVFVRQMAIFAWSNQEQVRFKKWFGTTDDMAAARIQQGLICMKSILEKLRCDDFLPRTAEMGQQLGCIVDEEDGSAVAAVCQSPGSYKIMLSHAFLRLRQYSAAMDSQVSTLIHELAHMPDVLNTRGEGEIYHFHRALALAKSAPERALYNSDNVAGYVMADE